MKGKPLLLQILTTKHGTVQIKLSWRGFLVRCLKIFSVWWLDLQLPMTCGLILPAILTSLETSLDAVPEPTYEDIVRRLKGYDDDGLQSYVTAPEVSPHLAFYTTNSANRGRGRSRGQGGRNRSRGNFSTRDRGFHQQFSSGNHSSSSSGERSTCQICGKQGHQALDCWHRYDDNYQQQEAVASALAGWHPDRAATANITDSTQRLQQAQP
ncbi:PREDICTED: uncharacterized protein LOC104746514 [Camelina sativa]|uniref:Uncharacterized protein LOC104746514 n=1 Tax=Camelina sativa TaxID=90675 RepID=A0ABM0W6C1_CAMSA|nr:PREDICTED: uncharacterized protein LOC104746514 [Camelina sativa]